MTSINPIAFKRDIKLVHKHTAQAHTKLVKINKLDQRSETTRYLITINEERWSALAKLGKNRCEAADQLYQKLVEVRLLQQMALESIARVRKQYPQGNTSLGKQNNWSSTRASISNLAKEQGLNASDTKKVIEFFHDLSLSTILSPWEKRLNYELVKLDGILIQTLSVFAAGRMAQLVGVFNKWAERKPVTTSVASGLSSLEAKSKRALKLLKASVQALSTYDGVHAEQSGRDAAKGAQQLGELAAKMAGLISALRRSSASRETQYGSYALRVANTLRLLMMIEVAGRMCEWLAKSPTLKSHMHMDLLQFRSDTERKNWLSSDGLGVCMGSSSSTGSKVLEGIVQGVAITHVRAKPVSSIVFDSNSKRPQVAYLSHIKIDSSGIVPGAYVKLRVKSESNLPWLKVKRANIVQRIDHEKESSSNWAMALSKLLIPIFNISPHSLAAEWSWEPGANGAANPLKYGVLKRPLSNKRERKLYASQV